MKKLRIVFNGIDYRIQWLGKTFFRRRPKWYWIRINTYAGEYIPSYSTDAEARNAMGTIARDDLAKKRGYTPV